jgi:nucleotide-binding universal stress UspA family protein
MSTWVSTKPVIVGVDVSRNAARAAMWAAAEAVARGVPLHVIHALDGDPGSALSGTDQQEAETGEAFDPDPGLLSQIEHGLRAALPTLEVSTAMIYDGAAGVLVAASRTADLVVAGTRGGGGFAGLPLGSVSLRLAAHSHCAVVLVRDRGQEEACAGEIVLGLEGDDPQDAVLFAFTQAARAGVGVHAIHAWSPIPGYALGHVGDTDDIARHAAHEMDATLKAARELFPGVPVQVSVERGHASAVLSAASRTARLTVVGAHRSRGPLSLGVGPVIQGLLSDAWSPVAVVPVA